VPSDNKWPPSDVRRITQLLRATAVRGAHRQRLWGGGAKPVINWGPGMMCGLGSSYH